MRQLVGPQPLLQELPVLAVVGVGKLFDLVAHHVLEAGHAQHVHYRPVGLPDNQVRGNDFLPERRVFKHGMEPGFPQLLFVGFGLLRPRHRLAGAQLPVFFAQGRVLRLQGKRLGREFHSGTQPEAKKGRGKVRITARCGLCRKKTVAGPRQLIHLTNFECVACTAYCWAEPAHYYFTFR
ncbi:hypothetical protein GCM10027511_08940 [Hymenobacter humi]